MRRAITIGTLVELTPFNSKEGSRTIAVKEMLGEGAGSIAYLVEEGVVAKIGGTDAQGGFLGHPATHAQQTASHENHAHHNAQHQRHRLTVGLQQPTPKPTHPEPIADGDGDEE